MGFKFIDSGAMLKGEVPFGGCVIRHLPQFILY